MLTALTTPAEWASFGRDQRYRMTLVEDKGRRRLVLRDEQAGVVIAERPCKQSMSQRIPWTWAINQAKAYVQRTAQYRGAYLGGPPHHGAQILLGSCMERMRTLPDASVHCVVTSPPYWKMRDYGHPEQLGCETTIKEHIARLVEVFREVRRVLRHDGTLWLNYGDRYASGNAMSAGLKDGDLCLLPERLALAMQDNGWWARGRIVWHKPNPVPEPSRSRPAVAHEDVYLFAASQHYFYDSEAIREPASANTHSRGQAISARARKARPGEKNNASWAAATKGRTDTRNARSVWTIPTEPLRGEHSSTFPTRLAERCILAGTSEKGCCDVCGAPFKRIVKVSGGVIGKSWHDHSADAEHGQRNARCDGGTEPYRRETIGWEPTCDRAACLERVGMNRWVEEPSPCIVFDPFAGMGTTGVAALRHGRRFLGVELVESYATAARARIEKEVQKS